MSFTAAVGKDGFFYNGSELFVEVGGVNRHPRAAISELTELLRPDKKQLKGAAAPDKVGHWYEAQLMHYGLPSSKDKARCKVRLLDALNNHTLNVPAS